MVACHMVNKSAVDVDMSLVVLELDMAPKEACRSSVLISRNSVTSASYSSP